MSASDTNAAPTVKGREMQTREGYLESIRAIGGVLRDAVAAIEDARRLATEGAACSTDALALAGRKARHAAAGVAMVLEEHLDLTPRSR